MASAVAADLERIGDIRKRQLGMRGDVARIRATRRPSAAAFMAENTAISGPPGWASRWRADMLLNDDVRVHAAGADGRDARAARQLVSFGINHARPRCELALHIERGLVERDVRIERFGVQRRRKLPVLHLHQHFGHARDARGGEQMGHVRFHRADGAELRIGRVGAEGLRQGADLDRIAQRRAGAVAFDVADGARIDARVLDGLADGGGLLRRARHREAVAHAGIGDGGALDDGIDVVAVALARRCGASRRAHPHLLRGWCRRHRGRSRAPRRRSCW